ADRPLLLIGTCRVDEPETPSELKTLLAALQRGRLAQTLALEPLSPVEHRQLLVQSLGKGEVEEALANQVFALTEGNPLFAVEMAEQLIKAGDITLQQGIWRLGMFQGLPSPPSLRILLAQRWHRLSTKAQALLDVAAIVGRQADLPLLESVLALP